MTGLGSRTGFSPFEDIEPRIEKEGAFEFFAFGAVALFAGFNEDRANFFLKELD